MIRRNGKVKKYGFIKRMEKEAMVGLCAVSFMMLTTGFTSKDVQHVTINVDGRAIEAHTAKVSPEEIFNNIGVTLNENDEYIVVKDGNDVKIKVLRAVPVTVKIEGEEPVKYQAQVRSVRDFLKSEGYDMDKYVSSIGLDATLKANMEIFLEDKALKAARERAAIEEAKKKRIETARGVQEYTDTIEMEASAYLPGDGNGDGVTAMGIPATYGVAAVDPRVIPLGTRLYIEGYGEAIAADTGGAIRGSKIDLCMESYSEAMRFGRRDVTVYILK